MPTGPNTSYRKIEWTIDQEAIAYDHKSDGTCPLITNDRAMSPAQVLEAHKGQPTIEKRFEQIKPYTRLLPSLSRMRGALKRSSLCIFSDSSCRPSSSALRLAMKRKNIAELPIYPERATAHAPPPNRAYVCWASPHQLVHDGKVAKVFDVQFTDQQRQVLALLGVSEGAFRSPPSAEIHAKLRPRLAESRTRWSLAPRSKATC